MNKVPSPAPPPRTEDIYGQEVIADVKRWQTCTKSSVGL